MNTDFRRLRRTLRDLAVLHNGDGESLAYLREFERTQFLSAFQLESLQFTRLSRLLYHAYRHCPYYHKIMEEVGFHPADFNSLQDLQRLPVLNKSTLQIRRLEMVSQNHRATQLFKNQTGGSTGIPVTFFVDHCRHMSRWAATVRHNRWVGLEPGDKFAALWGAPIDQPSRTWKSWLRSCILERCLFLDTSFLTPEILTNYHLRLQQFRPKVILAYARALVMLARHLQATCRSVYQPCAIITSAEVLEPSERHFLEAVFGCRVFNRYGCREVSVIASECPAHDGMHTMAEGLYIEIRPLPDKPFGEVIVTDLLNYAMPLIRYRLGDVAEWLPGRCTCGRELPRLKCVQGRVTDFLVGTSGQLVSGLVLATYIVAARPSLGQVQIVQTVPGEITYRLRPSEGQLSCSDAEHLRTGTLRFLGAGARCHFELVTLLPSEPSGKYVFSRSTVAAAHFDS